MERLIERLAGMREARTVVLLVTEGWRLFTIDQGWPTRPVSSAR
jgi:hypothetical protein